MTIINLSEAKAHLGSYARRAAQGESFLISDHNRPVARLVGPDEDPCGIRPRLGLLQGTMEVPDDFDQPLPGFEEDYYEK